jgi:rubrerythrin
MKKNLSMAEIIALAIRGEEDAITYYKKVSNAMARPDLREKCLTLAKEEERHRDMLLQLYRRMTGGEEELPDIPAETGTAEGGLPVALNDIESVLEYAVAREEEAEDFYRKAAERTEDEEAKKLFNQLADIENGHAQMFRAEKEAYDAEMGV